MAYMYTSALWCLVSMAYSQIYDEVSNFYFLTTHFLIIYAVGDDAVIQLIKKCNMKNTHTHTDLKR